MTALDLKAARALCDQADLQADFWHLLSHCVAKPKAFIISHPEYQLSAIEQEQLLAYWRRLQADEPLAYILQQAEFWGLTLTVTPDTLIPRPETEVLVATVLQMLQGSDTEVVGAATKRCLTPNPEQLSIIDLGTGSGAIALALKHELPQARIYATDISAAALAVAQTNAKALNLEVSFIETDFLSGINKSFDLIISNPPYIAADDPDLAESVKQFEPHQALFAADNGLAAYRIILQQAKTKLNADGMIIFEHGYKQQQALQQLATSLGYKVVATEQDLAGNDRVMVLQRC